MRTVYVNLFIWLSSFDNIYIRACSSTTVVKAGRKWFELKLSEVMSSNFVTINEDASVFEAVKKMVDNKAYGLVVVDSSDRPVGLLSERSLIKRFILRNKRPDEVQVKKVMRRPLPAVPISVSIQKVAEYLVQHGLERTTVTDKGKVVGYVTLTDLSRYLSRESIWDVLRSHRIEEFTFFCPKCGVGTLQPAFGANGEIKVFSCTNPNCDYTE